MSRQNTSSEEDRSAPSGASPGVLLLGHGSHIDPSSSDPIHQAARRLRKSGRHPEVRVAFWKEEPHLRHAFLLMESARVVAIPIFTSEGYFTDQVLPRELGIASPGSRSVSSRVAYTRPVGTDPRMADVVLERARDALSDVLSDALPGDGLADVTLVVLGHGTERHEESGKVVQELTAQLRRDTEFADVRCAFLDEDPRMLPVLEELSTPRAVVVPFFIAEGWHVGQTIPRDLGLDEGRGEIEGTEVLLTPPVGTHPALDEVIAALVAEAVEARREWGEIEDHGPAGRPLAERARDAFLEWIDDARFDGRDFLQTHVRKPDLCLERYEIRHIDDAGRPVAELESSSNPENALNIAALTEDGEHRPLKTAPDLRRGWRLKDLSKTEVWEAYAHLYPTAPVHWYMGRERCLSVTSFRETADRQTGIYAPVARLTDAQVEETIRETCAPESCLRRVRWKIEREGSGGAGERAEDDRAAEESAREEPPEDEGAVPGPEACSLFLTRARERV